MLLIPTSAASTSVDSFVVGLVSLVEAVWLLFFLVEAVVAVAVAVACDDDKNRWYDDHDNGFERQNRFSCATSPAPFE